MSTVKSRRDNLDDESVFRLFVDQVTDYAIFLLTPTGEVASWNPGAERIKGYTAPEIVGRHFRIFYPPEDIANRKPERELEIAAANGRFEEEGWRLRKDGSRFWASVIITAVRDHDRLLLGFGKLTKDLTERKNSEEQMRELSGRLLKMQDEERRRVGRELHDTVGQYLSAAKMSLDGLASEERFAENGTSLAESIQMIERCIREVRTLSYLLYPPMLEETGLSSAIRWHLEGFSKRSAIQTTFETGEVFGSFESALHKRLVDDHLRGDIGEFTPLPSFHLVAHRLKVSLHSVHAHRDESTSENDFECFASTGVNTPETMLPNSDAAIIRFPISRSAESCSRVSTFALLLIC